MKMLTLQKEKYFASALRRPLLDQRCLLKKAAAAASIARPPRFQQPASRLTLPGCVLRAGNKGIPRKTHGNKTGYPA